MGVRDPAWAGSARGPCVLREEGPLHSSAPPRALLIPKAVSLRQGGSQGPPQAALGSAHPPSEALPSWGVGYLSPGSLLGRPVRLLHPDLALLGHSPVPSTPSLLHVCEPALLPESSVRGSSPWAL